MLIFQQCVLMDLQAVDKIELYGLFEHTQGPETENKLVVKSRLARHLCKHAIKLFYKGVTFFPLNWPCGVGLWIRIDSIRIRIRIWIQHF
jgi:hypothetical protein